MKIQARSGDTLSYYSRTFEVPLSLVVDSNPKLNPNKIETAEEINIPGFMAVPYTIKPGDTFWNIALPRHLSVDTLILLNPLKDPKNLQAGETLLVPQRVTQPLCHSHVPYDYKNLEIFINQLKDVYPFLSVKAIGKSVLDKKIFEIRIGRGKRKVHMNGSFHANEWITTLTLVHLLNTYLLSLTNGIPIRGFNPKKWYYDVELSLVPMVNPDGVDLVLNGPPMEWRDEVIQINSGSEDFIHWKANIRGIDLNKQFPANWEIDQKRSPQKAPASRDFPGDAPLTEPEAVAMAELAKAHRFDYILAFHTQGEEFYWGYEGNEPPESAKMAEAFEKASGYKAVQYVDSHGGYKDWYIQEFRRPGFTIELGRGINPLPLSQFNCILQKAEAIFLTALSL